MVVLVTGCRSGFGLLLAEEAARRGHTVYAGLRDPTIDQDLRKRTAGLAVHPIALDVTVAEQRKAAVDRIVAEHGRIDALINNAGAPLGGFMEEVDEDELRGVMEVNFFGIWLLTKAVLPVMREQGSGTVVMMSSRSGRLAFPGLGSYSASKFALEGLSEAWRHELRPFGIGVYLVEPGPFRTDIWERNRKLARNALQVGSPYERFHGPIDRWARKIADSAKDPRPVVERTLALLGRTDLGLRHPVGGFEQQIFGMLPFGIREAIIGRIMTDRGPSEPVPQA
jgi:NAD(P)-dependent dehydrogenase (short-subunit alcohol dehydrogenase family)